MIIPEQIRLSGFWCRDMRVVEQLPPEQIRQLALGWQVVVISEEGKIILEAALEKSKQDIAQASRELGAAADGDLPENVSFLSTRRHLDDQLYARRDELQVISNCSLVLNEKEAPYLGFGSKFTFTQVGEKTPSRGILLGPVEASLMKPSDFGVDSIVSYHSSVGKKLWGLSLNGGTAEVTYENVEQKEAVLVVARIKPEQ